MDLEERAVLYCESGEDIDYVRILPNGGPEGAPITSRLLEQVKLRESTSVTLRSAEAVEAIANFLEVCERNSGLNILFRFFTNAVPGKEQGVVFPGGRGGIEAWERVRTSGDEDTAALLVRALRNIFASRVWPEKSAGARVSAFLDQSDDVAIRDLIMRLEWAMGSPSADELRPIAEERLLKLGFAQSPEQAEMVYERLLMHALRVIGSPGLKRLDRATLLELIGKGGPTAVERDFLLELQALARSTAEQLTSLAEEVRAQHAEMHVYHVDMSQRITAVENMVDQLTSGLIPGIPAVTAAPQPRRDEPPLLPVPYAPRTALAASIAARLREKTWVALRATAWTGKTQVARGIWQDHAGPRRWISLRAEAQQLTAHFVDQLLLWYIETTNDIRLPDRYVRGQIGLLDLTVVVASATGPDALLVIDDIPEASLPDLNDALASIAVSFARARNHVLSTSQVRLPREVENALGNDSVEKDVPPMSTADVRTLLEAAGAPDEIITGKLCTLVEGVTDGHPIFVVAAVRAMEEAHWNVDAEQISALLTGERFQAERQQARRAVSRLTTDPEARDLLDRLSIARAAFGYPMVTALAGVPPRIARPHEHLDALVGRWVEALPATRYEVTPPLRGIGDEVLSPALRKALHGAAAEVYLTQGTLDTADAWETSRHLAAAENWLSLAGFILRLAAPVRSPKSAGTLGWILLYFLPGSPWPAEIPHFIRVVIRAVQARFLLIRKQAASAYESDLEQLIQACASEDAPAVAAARYLTALPEAVPAAEMARRVLDGARATARIKEEVPETLLLPPVQLIWAAGLRVRGFDDLAELLPVIGDLTAKERQIVFSTDPGYDGAVILVEMAYVQERATPNQTDWIAVDRILAELERLGQLDYAEPLRAAAVRVRALVLADIHHRPEDALAYLERSVAGGGDETRFVLGATRAGILLSYEAPEKACAAFEEVLALPGSDACSLLRDESFRRGTEAAGRAGHWTRAREWCLQAVRAARETRGREGADPYIEVELLAELAWVLWQSGQVGRACGAMTAAVGRMMEEANPMSDRFRETFGRLSFLLGWLVPLATTGSGPLPPLGGAPLQQPFPGFTRLWNPDLSSIEDRGFIPARLLEGVARFAVATGHPALASTALRRAVRAHRAAGNEELAGAMEWERAHVESHRGAVAEAVEAAVAGARGMALAQAGHKQRPCDGGAAWEQLDPNVKANIEQISMFYPVILGTFLRLAAKGASREEANVLLDKLIAAIRAHEGQLHLYGHWVRLVDLLRLAFSGDARRGVIVALLHQQTGWDEELLLTAVLAQCRDAVPGDIVVAQAGLLTSPLGSGVASAPTRRDMVGWIIRTWRHQASERGFALRLPRVLRAAVAEVREDSALESDAARILFAAADASSAGLRDDVQASLHSLVVQGGG